MQACKNCEHPLPQKGKFCTNCGQSQAAPVVLPEQNTVTAVIFFYAIELIVLLVADYTDWFDSFNNYLMLHVIMGANVILFCGFFFDDIKPVLHFKSLSIGKVLKYSGITLLAALLVQYSMHWLNISLFETDGYFKYYFLGKDYSLLWMIGLIALYPAIFEEFAYRGFLNSKLEQIFDAQHAMYITAFCFALIHLSFLSLIWLFPFAVYLGYMRKKENTIWYGVICHFIFNSTACILEYYDLI
jgi:uncharacterized protein